MSWGCRQLAEASPPLTRPLLTARRQSAHNGAEVLALPRRRDQNQRYCQPTRSVSKSPPIRVVNPVAHEAFSDW